MIFLFPIFYKKMNFVELGDETKRNEIKLGGDYYLSEESNIGDKPDHFKILKLIGKGANGKVYKVLSLINNQIYAMKIFDKNIDKIKVNLNNKFNHPNIIRIYKSFEEKDKLYLIMEYMNNGNLKDFILMNKDTDNIFEENQIWSFLLQSMWALYFIHNNGYILRNIKPENILIDDNMKIKFSEFLSTEIKQEEESEVHPYENIEDKIWEETKKYRSKNLKGKQADIYSLGLILKELLDNTECDKKINKIIREMNKEEDFDELTKNKRTEIIFESISNFYSEKQNNSSIDSVVLCLKSFKCFENEFNHERCHDNLDKNRVFVTFHKILSELIYNQKSDFIYWNRYINELRLALIEENNLLEGIEEIEPEITYLQIMKIIINEKRKIFMKDNPNNLFTPNIIKYNIVNIEGRDENNNNPSIIYYNYINENNEILKSSIFKDLLGLMKIETKCTKCNLNNIEFINFLMMELNQAELLNEEKKDEKIELESILKVHKEKELKINCSQCSEITIHKCISSLYSLPNAFVIFIKDSLFDEKNCVNIKETMEINDCDKYLDIKKKYELVAMLKYNRNKNEQMFYSLSKFNERWFLSQRYKGIEPIEMNCSHIKSNRVRMVFYQSIN